jgi:hypothetical protein
VVTAQSGARRVAFDTVVGVQDLFAETRDWPTAVVVDPFVSAQIARGLQLSVRPKLWRLNGEWELVLDQASVQYEWRWMTNWRIEAGRFPSPVGLGMTENRSNVNPGVLWWHRPYYMPLPSLGRYEPRLALVSAIYPDGVTISTSADTWDARAAVLNEAPVRFWRGETNTSRRMNVVVGGGVTPRPGLRFGVSMAEGDLTDAARGSYDMVNVEADYAFGYTRVSGEWTRDRFDLRTGRFTARGWTIQAQQTLSPRWFAHGRATFMTAPEAGQDGAVADRTFRSLDTTVGYRVDEELTIRTGYSLVTGFGASQADHQAGVSVMWSRRWW